MKLSKDTYLYLTRFADDRTILNMLSVNKKFNDPKFFEEVIRNKYPLLIKYKPDKETWKRFYISMVYCISKIREDYGIPYYPINGYNPQNFCDHSSKQDILEFIMYLAVIEDQIDMVRFLIEQGANTFNYNMFEAAKRGHKDIVELMIQHGADDFDRGMFGAAYGGYKEIVELMIQKGANDFNRAMFGAARGGHKDIVELMIQLGANDFNKAMEGAATGRHKDITELMVQKGANNYKEAMYWVDRGYQ